MNLSDGHGEEEKREGNYGYRIGNNVRGSHDDSGILRCSRFSLSSSFFPYPENLRR